MQKIFVAILGLTLGLSFLGAGTAQAVSSFLNTFNSVYGTSGTALDSCFTCHTAINGTSFNSFGADFHDDLGNAGFDAATALHDIEPLDSDGDSFTNIQEITARTLPGDANDFPQGPPTDSDGDGVPDSNDSCPGTPPNAVVDSNGCVVNVQPPVTNGLGYSLVTVPDMDGSTDNELAFVGVVPNGNVRGYIRDSASGGLINILGFPAAFTPLAMAATPDLSGNNAMELAVLAIDANGKGRVNIKDTSSGAWVNVVTYPDGFYPVAIAVVPDLNGNSISELAVLGLDSYDGRVKVFLNDSSSRERVGTVFFPDGYSPVAMTVVPDLSGNNIPELAVLATDANGKGRVNIKDTSTGTWVSTLSYPDGFNPVALAVVSDLSGNNIPELAVLGTDANDGRVKAILDDSSSRARVKMVFYPVDFSPAALAVVPDLSGNNAPELAVLGTDAKDGTVKALLKDSSSGNWVNVVSFFTLDPFDIAH